MVLASSSGQPASALTSKVKRPERVLAAHFWFPATLIPVVEVCPSPVTAKAATERTMALLREAGKEPVLMQRETPGMIGNRIQFAILREAWAMWAEGIASAEAIDTVVRQTLGRAAGDYRARSNRRSSAVLDTLHAFRGLAAAASRRVAETGAGRHGKLVEGGARGFAQQAGHLRLVEPRRRCAQGGAGGRVVPLAEKGCRKMSLPASALTTAVRA